jgi:hypothetical protein
LRSSPECGFCKGRGGLYVGALKACRPERSWRSRIERQRSRRIPISGTAFHGILPSSRECWRKPFLGALQAGRDPSTARLLRIREAVASLWMTAVWSESTKDPKGMGPWNPTFRKGRETWGTPFLWSGTEEASQPPAFDYCFYFCRKAEPAPHPAPTKGEKNLIYSTGRSRWEAARSP